MERTDDLRVRDETSDAEGPSVISQGWTVGAEDTAASFVQTIWGKKRSASGIE
jgi:hypothetical protein